MWPCRKSALHGRHHVNHAYDLAAEDTGCTGQGLTVEACLQHSRSVPWHTIDAIMITMYAALQLRHQICRLGPHNVNCIPQPG